MRVESHAWSEFGGFLRILYTLELWRVSYTYALCSGRAKCRDPLGDWFLNILLRTRWKGLRLTRRRECLCNGRGGGCVSSYTLNWDLFPKAV